MASPAPSDARDACLLEEWRQARAMTLIAPEHEWIGGGAAAFGNGSWCSYACGLGLREPAGRDEADRLVRFYHERGAPVRLELAPFADEAFVRAVRDLGFRFRGLDTVFMTTIDAGEEPRGRMTVPLDASVRVEPYVVDHGERDEAFARLMLKYDEESDPSTEAGDLAAGLKAVRDPTVRNFAAYAGDALVGVGSCEIATDIPGPDEDWREPGSNAVCCFFGVTVELAFRKRGIQQAMIAERLRAARDAGCGYIFVHGPPGGGTARNAARMGFRAAYTKVELGLPAPE